jgi:tetratricopeptide (TPR) repeat protein
MRFAEPAVRCTTRFAPVLLLALALSGCASFNVAWPWKVPAAEPVAGAASATPPTSSAASTTPVKAAPAPEPVVVEPAPAAPTLAERAAAILKSETEVAPAVQRAYDQARQALRSGRVDEAERGFRQLAKDHPELGGPQANLGLIQRQRGKLAESAMALEKAVELSPRQASYYNQLGITYRQQGQFTKAREAYDKAIDLDPDYASAVLNLGILNDLYLWDGKRALELYDRYLALAPSGDAVVSKWIADLKNRKPQPITVSKKEQP